MTNQNTLLEKIVMPATQEIIESFLFYFDVFPHGSLWAINQYKVQLLSRNSVLKNVLSFNAEIRGDFIILRSFQDLQNSTYIKKAASYFFKLGRPVALLFYADGSWVAVNGSRWPP